MLGVYLGILVIVAVVTALTRHMPASSNLFSAYAHFFPGQLKSAVVARGFSCPVSFFSPGVTEESCILNLATGSFSQIQVTISHGVIFQTFFTLRGDWLKLGDLISLWGIPQIHEYEHSVSFLWPGHGVVASAAIQTGQFSPFLPVRIIAFTATEM
jgi:hypothetical protein